MSTYHFNEHRHRYAVWTAARAVQRNFRVTNGAVRKAIDSAELRSFAECENEYSHAEFKIFHITCATKMMDCFIQSGIPNVSYGRVAKIIAIYLKTSVVLCSKATCPQSQVIHPPVDRILLQNLSKKVLGLEQLAEINWTRLNSEEYWKLAELIRERTGLFDWQLEEFWDT